MGRWQVLCVAWAMGCGPIEEPHSPTYEVRERADEKFPGAEPAGTGRDDERSAARATRLHAFEVVRLLPPAAMEPARPPRSTRLNFDLRNADTHDAIQLIADAGGFNVVLGDGISGRVNLKLRRVEAFDALLALAAAKGWAVRYERGIVLVGPP